MEGRSQFNPKRDNLLLAEMDERRVDFDASVAGAFADKLLEGMVIGGAAVGVSRAILLHRADDDLLGSDDFGPAYGGGEEVGVAERNVGDRDGCANGLVLGGLRDCNAGIGERRSPDAPEEVDPEVEKVLKTKSLSNGAGRLQLPAFSALPVAEVEGVGVVIAGSEGCAYSGVHASGEADDGARSG